MSKWLTLGIFLLLSGLPVPVFAEEFKSVRPGYQFSFPRDHGAHPDYPVEWWYFTGHLQTKEERTFGFELTFFRVAINPTSDETKSPWHVQSLFLAHAAVTDDKGKQFFFQKKTVRPNFSQAKALTSHLEIEVDGWEARQIKSDNSHGTLHLAFDGEDQQSNIGFSLSLALQSKKPPVLQGDKGYSQKGKEVSDASYYVSFTRLEGQGGLKIGEEEFEVLASAWMDHEILSSQPNDPHVGWDWFAIQLDNGWECMLYHLRRGEKGKTSPYSAGSCVSPDGKKTPLLLRDYEITPRDTWKSPDTSIVYPSGWRLQIRPLGLQLQVKPTLQRQELFSPSAVTRSYWEGRCLVSGEMEGEEVSGKAYVELVGYEN